MKHFAKQIKWTKNQLTRLTLLLSLTKPEHLLTLVLGDVDTLLQLGIRMQYVCTACLGREHVQAALQTRISCKQCSKISPGILRRRAVFLQGVCSDPLLVETAQDSCRKRNRLCRWQVRLTSSDELWESVAFKIKIKPFPKFLPDNN